MTGERDISLPGAPQPASDLVVVRDDDGYLIFEQTRHGSAEPARRPAEKLVRGHCDGLPQTGRVPGRTDMHEAPPVL